MGRASVLGRMGQRADCTEGDCGSQQHGDDVLHPVREFCTRGESAPMASFHAFDNASRLFMNTVHEYEYSTQMIFMNMNTILP